jgi:spore coat polysaccharide biosynthesis protein SpsF
LTRDYKVNAVIQARMGSSRLPGKVLRPLGGRPVLGWVIRAAQASAAVDTVVVATTTESEDEQVANICADWGIPCVRGPDSDVLTRFLIALDKYPADAVVRLTADDPLLDPAVIAQTVGAFAANARHLDYLSTGLVRCLPLGLDVEVASSSALQRVAEHAVGHDRSHVTSGLYADPQRYRICGLTFAPPAADMRVTLDTPEDAAVLEAIGAEIGDRPPPWREVVATLRAHPDLVRMNAGIVQKALHEG